VLGVVCAAIFLSTVRGEDPAPPDRRELWVPSDQLATILKKHPRAVLLTREQYATLLRDAERDPKAAPAAPRAAVLGTARYEARAEGAVLQVTGTLPFTVNTDAWAMIGLPFGGVALGAFSVDGEAAILPMVAGEEGRSGAVLVRGKGTHTLQVEFTAPIRREAGLSRVAFDVPLSAGGALAVALPAGARVESELPLKITRTDTATTATLTFPLSAPRIAFAWRAPSDAADRAVLAQTTSTQFSIDAGKLRTEAGLTLTATLGDLPASVRLPIPEGAQVLQIEGDAVAAWTVSESIAVITLRSGERRSAELRVVLEQPSLGEEETATIVLPLLAIEGAQSMTGGFALLGDPAIAVQRIESDPAMAQTSGASAETPGLIASYKYDGRPAPPRVFIARVQPKFDADIDTLVQFKAEAVFIERTLTFREQRGRLFTATIALPAAEELLSVRRVEPKGETEPDWRREQNDVRLRWSDETREPRVFKVRTRVEPEKWTALGAEPLTFNVGDAKVAGAEKVTGYIALDAEPQFRLEAAPSETLERRDGRTTPVRGAYAWFRRGDFALAVKVAKRPVEVLAALTGYALPLEGVLDLRAQIAFTFLHSGARAVRIKVPENLASNFHFDGPQIAERNLAGDTWTILFQAELTGTYTLRVTAQVPIAKDAADPSRFAIEVPVITPLDVARSSGMWAVEANTETEISFAARGMNELDTLLAPPLADYLPRHRVIGLFGWLGADYALSLNGVRHGAAGVVTTVIDQLDLDTVASASGLERNQATLLVRTAGAQFLDVSLPEKSRILSLLVDDTATKPVTGHPGELRVQLPAKTAGAAPITVVIVYETAKSRWSSRGDYEVTAPRVAPAIPVLRSRWRVFVPDGFEVTGLEGNLPAPFVERPPLLVLAPARWYRDVQARTVLGSSEINNPMSVFIGGGTSGALPEAIIEAARRETPGYYNQTIGPRFRQSVEEVKKLLAEADGFFTEGRYDLAAKRYEQVLAIDRYNMAARRGIEKVNQERDHYANLSYQETRSRLMWKLDQAWESPIRKFGDKETDSPAKKSATSAIERKLQQIIIPKLEFREATIREAIEFLKRKTVELDPDPDPARRGVSIVMKLDRLGSTPLAPPQPLTPIPGLEPLPGAPPPDAPAPFPASPADARITISLTNIPLIEALRYVTSLANLKFKVEPFGVSIVPQNVDTTVLVTKEYKVRPGFIIRSATPESDGKSIAGRRDAKAFYESVGVSFPPGASATYIEAGSRVILRNTQENIDLADTLVQADMQGPSEGWASQPGAIRTFRTAGLLPIKLELPKVGQPFVLEGFYGAERVEFQYEDWWARARRLWIWFVVAAFLFLAVGRRRPWWSTAWALLVLSFAPLCLGPVSTPLCNALLGGWLTGLVVYQIGRRLVFAPVRREVPA